MAPVRIVRISRHRCPASCARTGLARVRREYARRFPAPARSAAFEQSGGWDITVPCRKFGRGMPDDRRDRAAAAHRHARHRPRDRGDGHIGDEHRRLRHALPGLYEPARLRPGRRRRLSPPGRSASSSSTARCAGSSPSCSERACCWSSSGRRRAGELGRRDPLSPDALAARLRTDPFLLDLVRRHPPRLRPGRDARLLLPRLSQRGADPLGRSA